MVVKIPADYTRLCWSPQKDKKYKKKYKKYKLELLGWRPQTLQDLFHSPAI